MHQAVAELPAVRNIMEFAKLVHMKNARDMTFHMLYFFFLTSKPFGGLQKPQPVLCPGCVRVMLGVSVTAIVPSVALHMHRVLPDCSEHGTAL